VQRVRQSSAGPLRRTEKVSWHHEMEGTAETDLHALNDPLPDQNGWDVHSRIAMLTATTCSPCGTAPKMHGLHGLSPKGWEGVAKTETIFWL